MLTLTIPIQTLHTKKQVI
uniref:Uncharacterized protein n=1 Tax=Anguilla anguilla TaxID=7936 RepID=A0A0E9VLT0_ANGAN